jgi:ribosomal protein S18 acetylase RimI-like enzyme
VETQAPTFFARTATADDQPLLFALFAAEKRAEFAPLSLTEEQLTPLLDMQYRARELSYAHPDSLNLILCLPDGTPAGRHLIRRQPGAYRVVDLAVFPEHRNRGLATWALTDLQQTAAREGLAIELRVMNTSPALRLYTRLGFHIVSSDELSFEMRWQPKATAASAAPLPEPHDIPAMTGGTFTRGQLIDRLAAFLSEVGLTVEFASVPPDSFLPGLALIPNGLRVDRNALLYPGDMLHEAGHLAVMAPEDRAGSPSSHAADPASEMAAIAWSWAAAAHLGIPPELVIHDAGYKGMAPQIRNDFASGKFIGFPILAWLGLTTPATPEQPSIYPRMLRWLREESREQSFDLPAP